MFLLLSACGGSTSSSGRFSLGFPVPNILVFLPASAGAAGAALTVRGLRFNLGLAFKDSKRKYV